MKTAQAWGVTEMRDYRVVDVMFEDRSGKACSAWYGIGDGRVLFVEYTVTHGATEGANF